MLSNSVGPSKLLICQHLSMRNRFQVPSNLAFIKTVPSSVYFNHFMMNLWTPCVCTVYSSRIKPNGPSFLITDVAWRYCIIFIKISRIFDSFIFVLFLRLIYHCLIRIRPQGNSDTGSKVCSKFRIEKFKLEIIPSSWYNFVQCWPFYFVCFGPHLFLVTHFWSNFEFLFHFVPFCFILFHFVSICLISKLMVEIRGFLMTE